MLHYRPKEREINDPNGPCYWEGRYHLFYQHLFPEQGWAWGHAISTDLVRWEELSDAILPSFCPVAPGDWGYSGADSCWSGAVCVDGRRAVAIFYGHSETKDKCGIYVMTASDPMLCQWKAVTEGPAILSIDQPNEGGDAEEPKLFDSLPYCEAPMLYDPCVWVEDGIYHVLSGGTVRDKHTGGFRRQEFLFTSTDLVNWTYCHPLISDNTYGEAGDDGACPYFLPWADGKTPGEDHRLLWHFSHQYGPRYVMGVYDKETKKFTPYNGNRVEKVSSMDGYHASALFAGTPDGSLLAIYVMKGRGMSGVFSMIHRLERCGECMEEISASPAADIDTLPYTRNIIPGEEKHISLKGKTSILQFRIGYDKEKAFPAICFHREDGSVFGSLSLHVGAGGARKRKQVWTVNDLAVLTLTDRPDAAPPQIVQLPATYGVWEVTMVLDEDILEVFFPNALAMGRCICTNMNGVYLSLKDGWIRE